MAAGDLTTLASVKAYLSITTPSSDTTLGQLITSVSAFVNNQIQRNVLTASYVEVRQGNGKERFLMRQWPVQSISLVEWAGMQISSQADLFSTQPGIATDGRSLILVGYSMPYGQPVRVTYTAGYDQPPADVVEAVNEIVGEIYTGKSHIGQVSNSANGQVTVSFSQKAMHDRVAAMLSNYMAVAPLC